MHMGIPKMTIIATMVPVFSNVQQTCKMRGKWCNEFIKGNYIVQERYTGEEEYPVFSEYI